MFTSPDAFWQFEHFVRQKARYIYSEEIQEFLDAVIKTSDSRKRKLRKGSILHRGQLGNTTREEEDGQIEVPAAFWPERMRPLPDCATEGRVNPKGIPCLYLAFNRDTAMAEVRPWVGAHISLAQFKVMKDCIVIDCSHDKESSWQWLLEDKKLDPSECEKAVWGDIARAFSKPVGQDDKIADYAPTQILAELFRHHGYDGVAYRSALGEGTNIALFDLSAAELINCVLFEAESVKYEFRQTDNPYYIPKYYPDLAKSLGLDEISPAAAQPHTMKINFLADKAESKYETEREAT